MTELPPAFVKTRCRQKKASRWEAVSPCRSSRKTAPKCNEKAAVMPVPTSCSQNGISAIAATLAERSTLLAPPPMTNPSPQQPRERWWTGSMTVKALIIGFKRPLYHAVVAEFRDLVADLRRD